jgi:hypothetical protein
MMEGSNYIYTGRVMLALSALKKDAEESLAEEG